MAPPAGPSRRARAARSAASGCLTVEPSVTAHRGRWPRCRPAPRRLVFLGTPDMAVPPLRALVAAGFDVALVVTRPDKRRGRGSALTPSPVKAAALELGLPVTHRVDDALDVGRRPRRGGRLRAR